MDDIWTSDEPEMKAGYNDSVGFGLQALQGRFGILEKRARSPSQEAKDKLNSLILTEKYQKFNLQEKEYVIKTLTAVPNIHHLNPEASLDAGLFIARFSKKKDDSPILSVSNLRLYKKIISYNPVDMVRYVIYLESFFI
ncbi:hypothetical protein OAG24_00210 [bacterium]|nr:hypothetical protein [bacterium]